MKKYYIAPSISLDELEVGTIIAQSTGVTAPGQEPPIGYGGLDKEGTQDPSAKSRNEWEDGLW